MSAPFEPNSITIIEMKGTEAIFHCAFCHPKRCTACRVPYAALTPPRRLIEMPKSKYYFIQMASYFHSRHDCTKLYTLAWRHNLNCPICLLPSDVNCPPPPPSLSTSIHILRVLIGIWTTNKHLPVTLHFFLFKLSSIGGAKNLLPQWNALLQTVSPEANSALTGLLLWCRSSFSSIIYKKRNLMWNYLIAQLLTKLSLMCRCVFFFLCLMNEFKWLT